MFYRLIVIGKTNDLHVSTLYQTVLGSMTLRENPMLIG